MNKYEQAEIISCFLMSKLMAHKKTELKHVRFHNVKAYIVDAIRQRQIKALSPYICDKLSKALYNQKVMARQNNKMFLNELNYRLDLEAQEDRDMIKELCE